MQRNAISHGVQAPWMQTSQVEYSQDACVAHTNIYLHVYRVWLQVTVWKLISNYESTIKILITSQRSKALLWVN